MNNVHVDVNVDLKPGVRKIIAVTLEYYGESIPLKYMRKVGGIDSRLKLQRI